MHVDLRAGGIGIDKWRGVVREGDPAAIPDSALWYMENCRLVGGKILSRGGQAAVNSVPLADGCIDGFFDAGDMGAAEDESLGDGVTADCGEGYGSWVVSRMFFPSFAYFDTTNNLKKAASIPAGTKAFIYDDGTRVLIGVGTGIYALNNNNSTHTLVCTTTYAVTSIAKLGSTYYVGCFNQPANPLIEHNSHIALWDGSSSTPSSTERVEVYADFFAARLPLVTAYNSDIVAVYRPLQSTVTGVNTTANTLYERDGGSWTAKTVPLADFHPTSLKTHDGDLWIGGATRLANAAQIGRIWSYDGSAVSSERSLASGAGSVVNSMISADGSLFYIWTDTTDGTAIGEYDGSFTDSINALSASVANWRFYADFGGEIYLNDGNAGLVRTASRDLTAAFVSGAAGACHGFASYDESAAIL